MFLAGVHSSACRLDQKVEVVKPYQQYMCAILSNPAWMKAVLSSHGRRCGEEHHITGFQLASAVKDLDHFMAKHFDVDEDAPEFDVESFTKDTVPPPNKIDVPPVHGCMGTTQECPAGTSSRICPYAIKQER